MGSFKKILTSVAVAAAFSANAGVVGGIEFASNGGGHIETSTIAQTFVNGNGQSSTSIGAITSVNGDTTYCATGSCYLYFVANFSNSQNFTGSYVEFLNATISVYYSTTQLNLLGQTSAAGKGLIEGMTPWLTLMGHNNLGGVASPNAVVNGTGQLTGSSLSGTGFGLFDVDTAGPGLADVIAAFDSNGEFDSLLNPTDVTLTSSFNNSVLNNQDVVNGLATGCRNGTAAAGAWCYQGTANLRGQLNEVPEPASIALIGIGLLAVGASRRRKLGK